MTDGTWQLGSWVLARWSGTEMIGLLIERDHHGFTMQVVAERDYPDRPLRWCLGRASPFRDDEIVRALRADELGRVAEWLLERAVVPSPLDPEIERND